MDLRKRLFKAGISHAYVLRTSQTSQVAGLASTELIMPAAAATQLVRDWNGRRYEVIVVPDGFEFEEKKYRSLTAVTKAITGTHWNGRAFFGFRNDKTKKGSKV